MLYYYLIFRLAYFVFIALCLRLAATVIGNIKLSLKDYYKIALHSFTLPLVLEVMLKLFNTTVPISFWIIGVNFIFGVAALHYIKTDNTTKSKDLTEV